MNKIMSFLESFMLPIAVKLGQNRYLNSLRDGFMLAMPLVIFGSIFVVVANLPFLPAIMSDSALSTFKAALAPAVEATFVIMTLFVVMGIGYNLLNYYNQKNDLFGGAVALAAFFILTPFENGNVSLTYLGVQGMFVGIISAFLSIEIYHRMQERGPSIKLPDGVPPMVIKSFAALVPVSATLIVFLIIRIIFSFTPFAHAHAFIYEIIQMPLMQLGSSLPAILTALGIIQILWFFGLHGQTLVGSIIDPILNALSLENLTAFQAGLPLPNIISKSFMETFTVSMGGSGMTLAVVFVAMFFMKSQQLKNTARLAAPAGLFNVNEPVIFGFPVVMNPIFFIPWVFAPMVVVVFSYFVMKIGLVPYCTGVYVPWTTPIFISGMLATNSLAGGILQLVNFCIVAIIWLPFLKVADMQNMKKEQEAMQMKNV
ncbi:MAG: PTS cellobiose transporter subunit IIC [Alphaproteobacteria bacterium]|jgi:PTS system cellobiose-specific IIC component|nr:PTS cellobiose transporter subunit IIC [Alphaproteobacteria bacterium]